MRDLWWDFWLLLEKQAWGIKVLKLISSKFKMRINGRHIFIFIVLILVGFKWDKTLTRSECFASVRVSFPVLISFSFFIIISIKNYFRTVFYFRVSALRKPLLRSGENKPFHLVYDEEAPSSSRHGE